jgi:uncharacterized protein YjiS (DUF1127 family)
MAPHEKLSWPITFRVIEAGALSANISGSTPEERAMSHHSTKRFDDRRLDMFVTTTSAPRLSLVQRLGFTFALWRQRVELRRRLAEMDSRSLRDLGISPAAAAYESGKPFWEKVGCLR